MSKFTDNYKEPTDDEITDLVQGLVGNNVLSTMHMTDHMDMIRSVFLPIGLGCLADMFDTVEELEEFKPIFYEFLDRAGPRSVNGWPMFMSMKIIKASVWFDKVRPKYKEVMMTLGKWDEAQKVLAEEEECTCAEHDKG